MNVFVAILRRIFKRKLSITERKEIIKKLKIKRNSYRIEKDGL